MTTHLYKSDISITLGIEVKYFKLMQLILKILTHYL